MTTKLTREIISDLAIPPGELLGEEMEHNGLSTEDLSERSGVAHDEITSLLDGSGTISYEIALAFEKVLGVPYEIWAGLESRYRLTLAREQELAALSGSVDWLDKFPINEVEKLGWIETRKEPINRLREVLKFLGVASPEAWDERQEANARYRITSGARVSGPALALWLRKGELDGFDRDVNTYNEIRFRDALHEIRVMTNRLPSEYIRTMRQACASAGVALVFVPELGRSGANGATRWINPDKALIQLSLRYKWADVFWFTFFHEASHVLSGKTDRVFVDFDKRPDDDDDENAADEFAADFLIPMEIWAPFVESRPRSHTLVEQFAASIGIAPGIVVGRLHHEGILPQSHLNTMRVRYQWPRSWSGRST